MEDNLKEAKRILKKYHQEHLLNFYNEIDEQEKNNLIKEILKLNFEEILTLYKNSMHDERKYKVTPIPHIEQDKLTNEQKEKYKKLGEKAIKNNEYAVVTMAGGQGTRLGYKGPKGTYEIRFKTCKKSLFEIICDDIKKANEMYNITINWYIMVSCENKEQTIKYFEKYNYFNYPKESIKFFVQDTIPLIDEEGKVVLQEYYKIKQTSNGNGNVFKALKKSKMIDDMESKNIKWVFFSGIDNVLLKNVDAMFLGALIDSKYKVASKTIFKEKPMEKLAVYCKKDNKPSILYYEEINLKMSEMKNEQGQYLYREANMLSHIMRIDAVKKVQDEELPYHRAHKKNPTINEEGMKIVPERPNTFKFENFIFDAFSYFDEMLLLRVDKKEEFAPIKDFTGIYTPETAREAYERVKGIPNL